MMDDRLTNLLNRYDEIIKLLNNQIDLWDIDTLKEAKIQKTLMLNTDIDKIISQHVKNSRLTYSDIVNIALKKGLEYIK